MTDRGLSEPGAPIAARLREARRGRGLSRRQLAEISKVSMRYLALLESGDGNVSAAILYRIATALDMPITGLLPDGDGQGVAGDMVARFAAATPHQKHAILEILGTRRDVTPDRRRRIECITPGRENFLTRPRGQRMGACYRSRWRGFCMGCQGSCSQVQEKQN